MGFNMPLVLSDQLLCQFLIYFKAGILFLGCCSWSIGIMADGYTRSTGKIAMCIAQNGPGITGLVTPIKTAYWNHTPMLLVTPQAANKTMGQGGFQSRANEFIQGYGMLSRRS